MEKSNAAYDFRGLEVWKRLFTENVLQAMVTDPIASHNNYILQAYAAFYTKLNFTVAVLSLGFKDFENSKR